MAKRVLGRGIEDIFEDVEESYNKQFANKNEIVRQLDVNKIAPNPYQPRTHFDKKALKELSLSIKKHGLLQPIIVYEKDDEYILLAGERRLRATKLAKQETIKAIVADIKSQNLRELALIENIQREDLNPIELAISYKELIGEYKITQDELANIIHKSRVQITNTMRLLNLSKKTQQLIKEGKISQGHAKVIVGLNKDDESMIVDTIIGQKLSVREAENLVKQIKIKPENKKIDQNILNLHEVKKILENFTTSVKIQKNSIVLKFENEGDVKNFVEKISK